MLGISLMTVAKEKGMSHSEEEEALQMKFIVLVAPATRCRKKQDRKHTRERYDVGLGGVVWGPTSSMGPHK